MIRFTASPIQITAAEGEGKREIMGVAAPYNVEATVSDGTTVKFLPGSLPVDGAAPKLIMDHDLTRAIGVVTERVEDENGVYFTAKVSKTQAGNEALELAKDGVLDAVSVGAEPIDAEMDENGVLVVASARWVELSLVPLGAFPQARVTQVAAAQEKENRLCPRSPQPQSLSTSRPHRHRHQPHPCGPPQKLSANFRCQHRANTWPQCTLAARHGGK